MSVSCLLQNTRCYACNLPLAKHNALQILARRYSSAESEAIIIPKRIPRGPTDILKALATTIKRDPSAPNYQFHDDPYLIPVSNHAKRTYALSQESGRKAAMWVKEQHPDLFQHIEADPPIQAYLAKPEYDEFDDVDEMTLLKTMRTASVNDSIKIYELLQKMDAPISEETKLCLLELICFFNGQEDLAEELIEERWFAQSLNERKLLKKTWKDNGFAEKLFSELPPSPRSYSAIIMGMVKYQQIEMAYNYYEESLAKCFPLSLDAYNSVIRITNFKKEGWRERWIFLQNILNTMNENGCKPNLRTLNRVLDCMCRTPSEPQIKSLALSTIAEARRFGVEPSLGTYHLLLNIFCRMGQNKRDVSYILEDILDEIEGKEFTARDITDALFFCNAMEKCRFYYNNSDIAFRLNRLLWHGKNYDLIGNNLRESVYYRHFFLTLCQGETLETIMEQYNFYVPNIYSPEMIVMEEIINVVTINGAAELYSKLWTDIVSLEMAGKGGVVSSLLKGMVLNKGPPSSPSSDIAVKLGEIAYSIFSKTEKDLESEKMTVLEWTGEMLGDIMLLCLFANDFEKAKTVMKKIIKDANKIVSTPSSESIEMMIDACIQEKDPKSAIMVIDYCHDNGYIDDKKFAKKVVQGIHLSPMYTTHIAAIHGQSIFQENVRAVTA